MATRLIPRTPSAYSYPLLLKNILHMPLVYAPDTEIVYRDISRYTYRDLNRRIHQLANALKSIGVEPGDTVAVLDWDSHRYLECLFAIPMMGAVLHTVNIRLSPDQLVYTMNHAEDMVVLVNSDFVPLLAPVKDELTTVKKYVLLTDEDSIQPSGLDFAGEYETLLSQSESLYDFPDFDENTMATTFYTTGTTGLPKGVYFSHRQLVLHTFGVIAMDCAYKSHINLNSLDVYMPITPMFHVHAWGFPYICTMLGAKQVYPGRYDPELLAKLIVKEKVTFSHCVPTILHMIVTNPATRTLDFSNWKVIIGGSALPKGLATAATDLGIQITSGYGMSETCPLLASVVLKPHMLDWETSRQLDIFCKTGIPAPLVQLEIVDPQGKPLAHDGKTTGEVVVRSPWLTQGYFKDPEKSEELWKDGWLHTGDIGFIDAEGYLQISDRLKDVIKTGGEWVSSLLLEDIISRHEAVSEAAVIGVPDERWGERPLAIVVLKEAFKDSVTSEDLKKFYQKHVDDGLVPKYGIPDRIILSDQIAKTSVGKMNKKELRKSFN
ncbi:MAG: fatty acid--CoA ligase [Desulfobacteraceae bacterium]|nr:fatty acid--CoA ligase [Desulfobacteraceae bacterium]MBU4002310.1 fatty acid--CoA ligase [Pseudomonadota bacterium]MBU4055465.1 fatty acid--CoA ligase [Pseudomonadota bacterium]